MLQHRNTIKIDLCIVEMIHWKRSRSMTQDNLITELFRMLKKCNEELFSNTNTLGSTNTTWKDIKLQHAPWFREKRIKKIELQGMNSSISCLSFSLYIVPRKKVFNRFAQSEIKMLRISIHSTKEDEEHVYNHWLVDD